MSIVTYQESHYVGVLDMYVLEKQTLIVASQVTEGKKDIKTKTKIMIQKNTKKSFSLFTLCLNQSMQVFLP